MTDELVRMALAADGPVRPFAGVLTTARHLSHLQHAMWSPENPAMGVIVDLAVDGSIASARRTGASFVELRANRRPSALRRGESHVDSGPMAAAASAAQAAGLVPVLTVALPGLTATTMGVTRAITANALATLIAAARRAHVNLSRTIVRVNLIAPGPRAERTESPDVVAAWTLDALGECVPDSVAGVWFVSGGHSLETTCADLGAVRDLATRRRVPWRIGFAMARALAEPALEGWQLGGAARAQQRLLAAGAAAHDAVSALRVAP